MFFQVLGPLAVTAPAGELGVAGGRRRLLLLRLLLDTNQPVSADELVDGLWGEHASAGAHQTLRSHIASLRKVLGPDRIVTAPPGYRIVVADEELDCALFDEETTAGQRDLAAGRPELARLTLGRALARWRGPAFQEAQDQAWVRGRLAYLAGQRLAAARTCARAALEVGAPADAAREAESHLVDNPYDETLWETAILGHYRSAGQGPALRCYRQARTALRDGLGLDTSPRLRDLERAILAQDESVLLDRIIDHGAATPLGAPSIPQAAPVEVGLPVRLASTPGPVVGRTEPIRLLDRLLADARGGAAVMVLVGGDAGIGKSTLIALAARRAHAAGAAVFHGHCDPDLQAPYLPFTEALASAAEWTAPDYLQAELGHLAPYLDPIAPHLAKTTSWGVLPHQDVGYTHAAVAALLGTLAQTRPVILVLDDIQWADSATVLLLRYLARYASISRVTVLLAYRLGESGGLLADLITDVATEPHVHSIELSGLTSTDVAELVARIRPTEGVDNVDWLMDQTAGNPLFIKEVLASGAQEGSVPRTVTEVVLRRIRTLGPDVSATLSAAAVIGREFDSELLLEVSTVGEAGLDALDHARRAGVLVALPESGRYRFAHALVRSAVADQVAPSKARMMHRRIALAIESRPGRRGDGHRYEVAAHWLAADCSGHTERAVRALLAAGNQALSALAPPEAAGWFDAALETLWRAGVGDDLDDTESMGGDAVEDDASATALADFRLDALIGLGAARQLGGDQRARPTLLRAARLAASRGDNRRVLSAAVANSRAYHSGVSSRDDPDWVPLLDTVVAGLDVRDLAAQATASALLAAELVNGPTDRRRALSDNALELARQLGDERIIATVHLLRDPTQQTLDHVDSRISDLGEQLAINEGSHDRIGGFYANIRLAMAHWERGELDRADRRAAAAARLADESRMPELRRLHLLWTAARSEFAGDLTGADAASQAAAELGRIGAHPDAHETRLLQALILAWNRGTMAQLVATMPPPEHPEDHLEVACFVAAEVGDCSAASLLDLATATKFVRPRDSSWSTAMAFFGWAAVRCRHVPAAAVLADLLRPHLGRFVFQGVGCLGAISHLVAALDAVVGVPDALDRLTDVIEEYHRLAAPGWAARAELHRAAAALGVGREGDTLAGRVTAARKAAEHFGFTGVLGDLDVLCAQLDPGSRRKQS